jgi:hypothetical protein
MGGVPTAGGLLQSEKWVAGKSAAMDRLWSGGVSVPRSRTLGSLAQRDVSELVRSTPVGNIPVYARYRDPLGEEATASAAGVVLANCGVIDAMVATLVDVESIERTPDWLLTEVAQPERSPMALVAF